MLQIHTQKMSSSEARLGFCSPAIEPNFKFTLLYYVTGVCFWYRPHQHFVATTFDHCCCQILQYVMCQCLTWVLVLRSWYVLLSHFVCVQHKYPNIVILKALIFLSNQGKTNKTGQLDQQAPFCHQLLELC